MATLALYLLMNTGRTYLPHIVKYKYTIRYGKIKLKHCWWNHSILKPITQTFAKKCCWQNVTLSCSSFFSGPTFKAMGTLWKTPLAGSCEIMKDLWVLEWRPRPVAASLRDLNRSLARNARYKQISYCPTVSWNDTIRRNWAAGLINVFFDKNFIVSYLTKIISTFWVVLTSYVKLYKFIDYFFPT